jgi:endo-1,4-beta-mannosidase
MMKAMLTAAILASGIESLRAEPSATMVGSLPPLAVRGVNYYPALTPWSGMWTKTPEAVWERDMALAASLNINTVRTFVPALADWVDAAGDVAPAYLDRFERFLGIAWRHGIRTLVCFEVRRDRDPLAESAWKRMMTCFVTPHRDDGRVLLWDLMNEPESRGWDTPTTDYLRAALPFIKELDDRHLSTVGIAYQIDRLAVLGLPDVMQYHEYAPKDQLFSLGVERVARPVAAIRRIGGQRPVLIGEFGMSTARDPQHGAGPQWQDRLPPPPGTEADQARLYRIVFEAAETLRLAGVMAWCLHSYPTREDGFLTPTESMFGLVRHDGTLKPAALLMRRTYARWRDAGERTPKAPRTKDEKGAEPCP